MGAGVENVEGRGLRAAGVEGAWDWLRRGRWVKWFVRSAGVVLLVTGLAKLWSAMGEGRVLGLRDPLFGLRLRQLMTRVGLRNVLVRRCAAGDASRLPRSLGGRAGRDCMCRRERPGEERMTSSVDWFDTGEMGAGPKSCGQQTAARRVFSMVSYKVCPLWALAAIGIVVVAHVQAMQSNASDGRALFHELLTNCPPIRCLILTMHFNPGVLKPRHYCFRYQPDAFYARELSRETEMCETEHWDAPACGLYEESYWSYKRAAEEGSFVLWTWKSDNTDTNNDGYIECMRAFLDGFRRFGFYTSGGLSFAGVNSVRIEDDVIISHDPLASPSIVRRARLDPGIGAPRGALVEELWEGLDKPVLYRVEYEYDPAVAPAPFPVTIRMLAGIEGPPIAMLHVRRLEPSPGRALMPRTMFLPPALMDDPRIPRVVLSNGAAWSVVEGRVLRMDRSRDPWLSHFPEERRALSIGAVLLITANTLFLGILVGIMVKRKMRAR